MQLNRALNPSPIKSVQRGTALISGANVSVNVTVAAVNMAKSQLRLLGISAGGSSFLDSSCLVRLTTTTNIAVERSGTGGVAPTVSWELVEYV